MSSVAQFCPNLQDRDDYQEATIPPSKKSILVVLVAICEETVMVRVDLNGGVLKGEYNDEISFISHITSRH
jgi:hypothetical protein